MSYLECKSTTYKQAIMPDPEQNTAQSVCEPELGAGDVEGETKHDSPKYDPTAYVKEVLGVCVETLNNRMQR